MTDARQYAKFIYIYVYRQCCLVHFAATCSNWKMTYRKLVATTWKRTEISSVKCSWTFGIYSHSFECIWVCGGPFSQWKFDSPIFFQPQHGRHFCLWISQTSWLVYIWPTYINLNMGINMTKLLDLKWVWNCKYAYLINKTYEPFSQTLFAKS